MSEVKSLLLTSLHERYPDGFPGLPPHLRASNPAISSKSRIEIPENEDDIILGMLIDKDDAEQGFEELVLDGSAESVLDSAKAMGLGDGGVVAFRFRGEQEGGGKKGKGKAADFEVVWPGYNDEEVADMEGVERNDADEEEVEEEEDE
jgi:hypothetical protein